MQMLFAFGHHSVSRNGPCDAEAQKAFDQTQLTDRWITGIVALVKHIIHARQLKAETHRSTAASNWKTMRTDSTVTRGEEAALARLRTGVPQKHGWLLRPLRPAIPSKCRCCGPDAQQRHSKSLARKLLFLPLAPTPPRSDAPAYRPVCGKHRSCCTGVVTRMILTPIALRAPRCRGKPSSPVSRHRQNPVGTATRHLREDESERRHTLDSTRVLILCGRCFFAALVVWQYSA
ncbi:hypothetical protein C3747_135g128 [Trypanosoma cruzi]|uniref:Uncharacterized protein n=1 Tax=Trypanosoma cruzi TaxID=5693 RepID=A0A2V2WAA3_TRYCR|nr:hypothetical protein C3747_135g128 [Trypanosoma cruzi]